MKVGNRIGTWHVDNENKNYDSLDWIQSIVGSNINTNYYVKGGITSIQVDVMAAGSTYGKKIFEQNRSQFCFSCFVSSSYTFRSQYYTGTEYNSNVSFKTIGQRNVIRMDSKQGKFYVDGVLKNTYTTKTSLISKYPLKLFCNNSTCALFSCDILESEQDKNVFMRKFRPALSPDGEPCLYDLITKQYYYSTGTDALIGWKYLDTEKTKLHVMGPSITGQVPTMYYKSKIVSASFPNASSVDSFAFSNCTALETVDVKNVKSINKQAFESCTSLKYVDMTNADTIDYNAFSRCAALESIDISNAKTIGDYAFIKCTNLKDINGSAKTNIIDFGNVTSIGNDVFRACTSLGLVDEIRGEKIITAGWFTGWVQDGAKFGARKIYFPNMTSEKSHSYGTYYTSNFNYLGKIYYGLLTSFGTGSHFGTQCGLKADVLSDGYRCHLFVKNTMSSLLSISATISNLSTNGTAIAYCADGKLLYENKAWTQHPYNSVGELPPEDMADYHYVYTLTDNTQWQWNPETNNYIEVIENLF